MHYLKLLYTGGIISELSYLKVSSQWIYCKKKKEDWIINGNL